MSLRATLEQQRDKLVAARAEATGTARDAIEERFAVFVGALNDPALTADECRVLARRFRRFGNYAGSLAWGEVADLIEREGQ